MKNLFTWILTVLTLLIVILVLDRFLIEWADRVLLAIFAVGMIGSGWYLFWRHK